MSTDIIQLNPEVFQSELKGLVKSSIEENKTGTECLMNIQHAAYFHDGVIAHGSDAFIQRVHDCWVGNAACF